MKLKDTVFIAFFLLSFQITFGQKVDYSIAFIPEEAGLELIKVSSDNDHVAMPLVRRNYKGVSWNTARVIDISPDTTTIAFISSRDKFSNIFIKPIKDNAPLIQRTNRSHVSDFSYSPDGEYIVFSEKSGKNNLLFQTNAKKGFICRQITSGNDDYSPVYSKDMNRIFFTRQEEKGYCLWSYDLNNNFLSSYSPGMNPHVISNDIIVCSRMNEEGRGEIWRLNIKSGIEECLVSDAVLSFSSPCISPNGQWLVFVGGSPLAYNKSVYWNTDIYVCRIDGSNMSQLTYHAADDLSPIWSKDGRYIYFVSQRGNSDAVANIWRLSFNY